MILLLLQRIRSGLKIASLGLIPSLLWAQHSPNLENSQGMLHQAKNCEAELSPTDLIFVDRIRRATRSGLSDRKIADMVFRGLSEAQYSRDKNHQGFLASFAWQTVLAEKRNQALQKLNLENNSSLELLKKNGLKLSSSGANFDSYSFDRLLRDPDQKRAFIDLFPESADSLEDFIRSNGRKPFYFLNLVKIPHRERAISLEEHQKLLREKLDAFGSDIENFVRTSRSQSTAGNLFIAGWKEQWGGKADSNGKFAAAEKARDRMIDSFMDLQRNYGLSKEDSQQAHALIRDAFDVSNANLVAGIKKLRKNIYTAILSPVAYPIVAGASATAIAIGTGTTVVSAGIKTRSAIKANANSDKTNLCAVGQKFLEDGASMFVGAISSVAMWGVFTRLGSLTWKTRLAIAGGATAATPVVMIGAQRAGDKKMAASVEGQQSDKLLNEMIDLENRPKTFQIGDRLDQVVFELETTQGRKATAQEIENIKRFLDLTGQN